MHFHNFCCLYNETRLSIHLIRKITTTISIWKFSSGRKIKSLTPGLDYLRTLRWMNVILKYVVPYYAHRYCISRIVNVKWNEKKINKKRVPFGGFYYFFNQNAILQSFLYFRYIDVCILQDDSCSSYWFKIFLTNWRNGWLRRQIVGLKSSKISFFH